LTKYFVDKKGIKGRCHFKLSCYILTNLFIDKTVTNNRLEKSYLYTHYDLVVKHDNLLNKGEDLHELSHLSMEETRAKVYLNWLVEIFIYNNEKKRYKKF
jgi:hypothetical protein